MTTTPPDAPSGPPPGAAPGPGDDRGPRVTREQVRDLGRLRRSTTDRKVAGVAGGLARHLDVDPLVLRVTLVVLIFFGGAGLILYAAAWLLVPEDTSPRAPFDLDDRSRSLALLVAGVVATISFVGDVAGTSWQTWPVGVVSILVLVVLLVRNLFRRTPRSAQYPAAQYPAAQYPTAQYPTGQYPVTPPAQDPGQQYTAYPPVPPRAPSRRRGPILFWFTLALIALLEGILGICHLAGVPVAPSAYPALAVGVTGLMLLVGSFFGRAGGLILLGLVATVALAGSTAADHWSPDTIRRAPTSAATVESSYDMGAGDLVLDLRHVADPVNLDGRHIDVQGGVGHLEVILPADLGAQVDANVGGPGSVELFGSESGGIDVSRSGAVGAPPGGPEITIDAELGIGRIEVVQR